MNNQSTINQQEKPNFSPAGHVALFGNGGKVSAAAATASIGGREWALTESSSTDGGGGKCAVLSTLPTPLLSPPLSSDTALPPPTDIPSALLGRPAAAPASSHTIVPLLTPDSSPSTPSYIDSASPHASLTKNNTATASNGHSAAGSAHKFLETLFPANAAEASQLSQPVTIRAAASKTTWQGALLDAHQVPGSPVLLVGVPAAEGVEIREHVEILLDLASDSLGCSTLVFVLDSTSPDLRELVHGLLFIGGTIVRPDERSGWEWKVARGKVLIGMEL